MSFINSQKFIPEYFSGFLNDIYMYYHFHVIILFKIFDHIKITI